MSLRNRVAIAVGLLVLVALSAAAAVLYPLVRANLQGERDQSLIAAVVDAPAMLKAVGHDAGTIASGARVLSSGPITLQIVTDPKSPGAGASLIPVSTRDLALLTGRTGPYLAEETVDGQPWRAYTARLPGSTSGLVRAASPEAALQSTLAHLLTLLIVITVAGALLFGVAARLIAGRVLRPVIRLTRSVERIADTGDLTMPIQTRGRDEIARLSRSFATMMAAVDDSVRSQRQLVADASHELRTPLTSLTTNLDLLAEGTGQHDDQAPALIADARQQTAELTALVNDLIELARYGQAGSHLEDVRVDLLAAAVADRAARRTAAVTIHVELCPALVHGDPEAIERAIGNLVDNAIKWSPAGGEITVQVTADGIVSVTDQGPGIPAADLPHIFDRFYRSPAARSMPGSGLGLAIVRQVALAHGGTVDAEMSSRGTRLRMALPTVTAEYGVSEAPIESRRGAAR